MGFSIKSSPFLFLSIRKVHLHFFYNNLSISLCQKKVWFVKITESRRKNDGSLGVALDYTIYKKTLKKVKKIVLTKKEEYDIINKLVYSGNTNILLGGIENNESTSYFRMH